MLSPDEDLALIGSETPDALLAGSRQGTTCLTTPVSPFSLRQQFTIPRLLRQQRIDLYHSTYYLMPYRTGIPTVLTVYDLIPIRCPGAVSGKTALLFRLFHRLALSAATRIIAISGATRDDLVAHYKLPKAQIRVISLGVSAPFSPAPRSEIDRLLEKYSLPAGFVLYVGINKPHKNLATLVQAWGRLKENGSGPPLLVICGPWDPRYPQALALIEKLGLKAFVRVLGPVVPADLSGLYSAARLFVFPSLYEGFGLPVLEAMACGAPVACSDIPALREGAGAAAAFFDPRQPGAIAEVVASLIDDQGKSGDLRNAGLFRTREFTWQAAAESTLRLYRGLLN